MTIQTRINNQSICLGLGLVKKKVNNNTTIIGINFDNSSLWYLHVLKPRHVYVKWITILASNWRTSLSWELASRLCPGH